MIECPSYYTLQVPGKRLSEVTDVQRTRNMARVTVHGALRDLGPVTDGMSSAYRKVMLMDTYGEMKEVRGSTDFMI